MTFQEFANKYGARKTAIKLVDYRIFKIIGLMTSDLPDTSDLCNIYDELESLIEDGFDDNKDAIKDILSEIDLSFIENQM